MKKMLSLILCLATIFSSVAFCFPAIAADLDYDVETGADYATLPAEEQEDKASLAEDLVLPLVFDFEDGVIPDSVSLKNQLGGAELSVVDKGEGKAMQILVPEETAWIAGRVAFKVTTDVLPAGRYRISADFAADTYPEGGYTLYVYYGTNNNKGKFTSYSLFPSGTGVTEDGTVTAEVEFDEGKSPFEIQYALFKDPQDPFTATYTLDNVKLEEIPMPATVLFDANGGSGSQASIKTETGANVALPEKTTFTRDYYDFVGWGLTSDAAVNEAVSSYTVVLSELTSEKTKTFYALWQRRTFDVEFDFAGGSSALPTSYTVNEGEAKELKLPTSAEVKRPKNLLVGWKDSKNNEYKCGETVSFTEATTLTAVWLDTSEFGTVSAAGASGYAGKTVDVDYRYPGAYYKLPVKLDADTVTLEALNLSNASAVEYDEENDTLIVYPRAYSVFAGATISFAYSRTTVLTADHKSMLILPEVTVKYISDNTLAGYDNLIPSGDAEGGYFPYFTGNEYAMVDRAQEEGGNHYARLQRAKNGSQWPHTQVNVRLEKDATYKFTGRYRVTGDVNGGLNFNVTFNAPRVNGKYVAMPYSNPSIGIHDNGFNHNASIDSSKTWKDVKFEFTVNKASDSNGEGVTIYSNPASNLVTTYDVDDFALYKRIDVTYSSGAAANLPAGASDPETHGGYMDDGFTTLAAANPYAPISDGWKLNEEKPWIDQFGNTYAFGEKVDVSKTGPLAIVPNYVTEADTYTLTFVTDGLTAPLAPVKVIVGEPLDFSKIENVTPADSSLNFNGWSTTGEWKDVLHGKQTIKGDMTLYPVLSINYDFAVKSNRDKFDVSNAVVRSELYRDSVVVADEPTGNHDIIYSTSKISLPARLYKGMYLIFDSTYNAEGAIEVNVGYHNEGLFFGRAGEGASGGRNVGGTVTEITPDGYALELIETYKHKQWTDTICYARFDPFQKANSSIAIRGLYFIPAEPFATKTVELTGLTAPVSGQVASNAVTETTGICEQPTITWSPALVNGRFEELTPYTATITLSPKSGTGNCFAPDTKVTVDGKEATTAYDEKTGLLTATVSFPITKEFAAFDYDIVGETFYLIDGKTVPYSVKFTKDEGVTDRTVTWSVDNTDVATIDAKTGVLTPIKNGKVVVTATSEYNYMYSKSLEVTIDYYEFAMQISGPDFIQKADRTTQYKLSVICEIALPDMTAAWSIESGDYADGVFTPNPAANYATISENGRVVPSGNGFVRISGISNYNPAVSASKIVEITNQAEKGTITYHPGTTDTVTGLPEVQEGYGTTALSNAVPTRSQSGYAFLGWATSDESADLVSSVLVPSGKNVDVYAVWGNGIVWTYGTNGNQKLSSNVTGRGADYDEVKPTVNDYRIHMPLSLDDGKHGLDPQEFSTVIVRMSSTAPCRTQIYYKTKFINANGEEQTMGYETDGFAYAEAQSMSLQPAFDGLDNFKSITFDFMNNDTCSTPGKWRTAKEIVQIYVDPCKVAGQLFRISSISVLGAPTVSFDKNTTDTVTNMPTARKASMGAKLTVSETPVREGYAFAGWSKSPTDRSNVKTTFGIAGDVTLYAVWDKNVDINPDDETGENVYTIRSIEASQSAVLVKVGNKKGVRVEFVYTDENSDEQTITTETNGNGYAVIDLSNVTRPIVDSKVILSKNYKATSIVLTDIESATVTANKVVDSGKPSSGGSGGNKNYNYDGTVTDIKNDGKQYEVGGITTGGEVAKTVLSATKEEGDILFNFEEDYEKDLFKDARQMNIVGMNSSVLSLQSLGKKSGSNDSPAYFTGSLALDAATHKYIVIKAKQSGLSNNDFRIYFHGDGANFSEANAETQKLGDGDYTMLVYDMGAKEGWKDTITALFFSLGGDVKGNIDIDWILFTNKVPESMDDVTGGAKVNFPVVNKDAMPFTDVTASDWFYSEVANAYKLGFVEGTSAANYEPSGSVTIAEAITLAVRLNYIYNEKTLPKAATEGEWFKPFVDAAVRAGIIKTNQFAEYDVPALRKQVAAIMAKALPNEFYKKMNMFIEVPDLDKKDSAYSAVLKLYNAGIVIGSDDNYNFLPETNIIRAEIAAIVNRIANPANRKRVVTEAEIESKKKKYYADDIAAACSLGNCTAQKMTVKDGVAWATGKSNDPIVYLTDMVGQLNGKEVKKITVGLKWDPTKASPAQGIFFTTPSGSWAAERFVKADKSTEHENGVTDFVMNVTTNGQFANTITGLRFDPFDAAQEFGIAYIIIE